MTLRKLGAFAEIIRKFGVPNVGALGESNLSILDALPAAVYITDTAGRIMFHNEAAAELWGCRPEIGKSEFCGSWKLYWPDGTPLPHYECPMALALRERRPVRGMEAVAERPDGTRVPFLPFPTPLFDDDGEMIGAVNMLVDVSEQRRLEQQLVSIVESSDDAIASKDLDGIVKTWNKGAERLFGYTAQEMIGKPVALLIPDDRQDEEPAILARVSKGERIEHYETVRRRKDGSLVDISLTVSPVNDPLGRIIGASKIARDITDSKQAERQQTLLLGEMQHRVKNTLATVQALATQTFKDDTQSHRESFGTRLQALAKAHDLLTNKNWDRAQLHAAIDRALAPFDVSRFDLDGPEVWLPARQVLTLSLVLHELATNAAKYGALSNETGRVHFSWRLIDTSRPETLGMTWEERGGPPAAPPSAKGFGSKLMEHTLSSVHSEYRPEGLRCACEITL